MELDFLQKLHVYFQTENTVCVKKVDSGNALCFEGISILWIVEVFPVLHLSHSTCDYLQRNVRLNNRLALISHSFKSHAT